jgi:signal transduction histidine kinase
VQAHGGVVWVDDNPGGGTRFWFTLDDVQEAACVSS